MAGDRLFDEKFKQRYLVEESLGSGGAGQVFKALQKDLDRFVAIKFINPRMFKDQEAVARFRQEGEIASQLVHPNVVQVYDIGESNNYPYIVYELVEGKDLAEHIQRLGSIEPQEAMAFMDNIASGLALAHDRNIIHRDLKAENILIDSTGKVKLADFGIAKAQTSGIKTETGVVLGTPSYMSPEQVRGERVTPASDIYSLGVIFFEMLTGRLPFWAKSPMETALKHLHDEPPRLDIDAPPTLRTRLDRMIRERMLAKDLRDRYQTAGEFLRKLKDVREGKAPGGEIATKAFHVKDEKTKPVARDQVNTEKLSADESSTRPLRAGRDTVAQSRAGTKAIDADKITSKRKVKDDGSSRNRLVVLGLIALVVFVFSFSVWLIVRRSDTHQLAEGETYDVLERSADADYYEVKLTWRSSIAYPTEVQIWPKGRKDEQRIVKSPGERDAVTRHNLKVEDLVEATIYQYRIVFPDGNKSFQGQFTTKGFRLLSCTAQWQGPGLFHVDINTVNPHQVRLVVNVGGAAVHEESSRGIHTNHHFAVRVEQFHRTLTYDVFFYKAAGEVTPTKFLMKQKLEAYTHKMDQSAKAVIDGVNSCGLRKTIKGFADKSMSEAERKNVVEELLERAKTSVGKVLNDFAEHRKFYFDNSTINVFARQALYEAISEVEEANHYAKLLGLSSEIPVSYKIGGDYALDYQSRATPTYQFIPMKFETHYKRFDDYVLLPVQPPPGREIKPLVVDRLSAVTRAEFDIKVEGLTAPTIFILRVNSRFVYRLRRKKEGITQFCQAIDPRALQEGPNNVDFAVEVLPGFKKPSKVRVVRAVLGLDRRR